MNKKSFMVIGNSGKYLVLLGGLNLNTYVLFATVEIKFRIEHLHFHLMGYNTNKDL